MSMREIAVGDVPVRALRVTFVGELGWELYCPTEYGAGLWRTLWEAGEPLGLRAGGYRAIDSLRLEKGYRVWAADITPDETPLGGGPRLLRAPGQGLPRTRGARRAAAAPALRCLVLDDPRAVALGNEPVRVGGEVVGRVTSGGYGYTRRALDRLRLPAARHRARHPGRGRRVRNLGARHGDARAAV